MTGPTIFLRQFAPEHWSPIRKFANFAGPPFRVDAPLSRGIGAVLSHIERAELLGELANELAHELERDTEQLKQNGFTHGRGGKRFAALSEAMIGDLYSALD